MSESLYKLFPPVNYSLYFIPALSIYKDVDFFIECLYVLVEVFLWLSDKITIFIFRLV